MNEVVLIGRFAKDPELRYTPAGKAVATFPLAVQREYNRDEADFINIVVWDKPAENVAHFCSKGKEVAIKGRIQVRSYENNEGRKITITEVVAEKVKFIGSRSDGSGSTGSGSTGSASAQTNQQNTGGLLNGSRSTTIDDNPFDL